MSKILLLIILLIGLLVGIFLISQQTSFFSKASADLSPKEVKITNISENSLTVSFLTGVKVPAFIKYGTGDNFENTAQDDRDEGSPLPRFTHHITLKNLQPETFYFYKISSGGKEFGMEGKPYQFFTAPVTQDAPPVPQPVFGKVLTKTQQNPQETLVYIKKEGATILSTFTKEDGNFLITVNNFRSSDLKNYIVLNEEDEVEIKANGGVDGIYQNIVKVNFQEPIANLQLNGIPGTSFTEGKRKGLFEGLSLDIIWKNFNKTGKGLEGGDLNNDGVVNSADFAIWLNNKVRAN